MARHSSPLPQGERRGDSAPVRLTQGFTQFLPTRNRIFFERQFVVDYLDPIHVGGASPFPREIDIVKLQAPRSQAWVVQRVSFFALQHNGIGVDGVSAVPRGESMGTLAFKFNTSNRGMLDFSTNLPGNGPFVSYGSAGSQTGVGVQPRAGQGQAVQGTGTAVPSQAENSFFANYVMPGQPIKASVIVLRPPAFDMRAIGVEFGGWLADAKEMQAILDSLTR